MMKLRLRMIQWVGRSLLGLVGISCVLLAGLTRGEAASGAIVLNEVLADNVSYTNSAGAKTDWVELYNRSSGSVDLAGMSLSDDSQNPRLYVFPAGSIVPAGGFFVVEFNGDATPSALNTGVGLSAAGDAVTLYERPENGGGIVDSITFGPQAGDYSLGRVPDGTGVWALSRPSYGASNTLAALGAASSLKINEWLANSGGNGDWFELFNTSDEPVSLTGLFLTDDAAFSSKFALAPLSFIGAGSSGYRQFLADNAPLAGLDHVNFKLAGSGGYVGLYTSGGALVDGVTFGAQQLNISEGRWLDGSTNIIRFPDSPSPGRANFLPITNVVINELLSHTDPPLEDALELLNPTSVSVDVSGWFLSQTRKHPKNFRIPNGTVIPAGGYKVIYETSFDNGGLTAFTFNSAHGGEAVLSSGDADTNFTGFQVLVTFGGAANGVSFGRWPTSAGVDFVAMSQRTFGVDAPATRGEFRQGNGLPNGYPRVGPVVINEIMYHPVALVGGVPTELAEEEFVELRNITAEPVPLFDPDYPTNTWQVRNGIDYTFATNQTLAAGGCLLLVAFDPVTNAAALAGFRAKYSVPTNASIYGPYAGRLSNSGEPIELYRPDATQQPPHPDAGFVPQILVDAIHYGSAGLWPATANGGGVSLQRRVSADYGNDPDNWEAKAPTAGAPNSPDAPAPPVIIGQPVSQTVSQGNVAALNVAVHGTQPVNYQWRRDGMVVPNATNAVLLFPCAQLGQAGSYTVLVANAAGSNLGGPGVLTVNLASPPTWRNPAMSNGHFSATLSTHACLSYVVECKTSLADPVWTPITNVTALGKSTPFADLSPGPATRFYRVRVLDP
jgi:hypothetical protein